MRIRKGKFKTKVPAPAAKPRGLRLFGPTNRQASQQGQNYRKDALREDPSEFGNFGFGMTGLTGES